jgi:hypothetical protein
VACLQVGQGGAGHREKLREGQRREREHHSHRNYLGPPVLTDLAGYIRGDEMFYTPELKGVLGVGLVRRLDHPDACAHRDLVGPADTIARVVVRRGTHYHIDNYRLQVVGEGDSMPHCNWVCRCVMDNAFHLVQPQVEGRPPDRHPAAHRHLHEGSKIRYA